MMKLAVMQPYFFPYIGYYQLVNAVDKFILYDDVNFIKGGWVNRNNIIQNNEKKLITLNLIASSSYKHINDIYISERNSKILKTINQSYSKAPFFDEAFPVIENILKPCSSKVSISEVAGQSIIKVSEYLNMDTAFEYSSKIYSETKGMDRADRLVEICQRNNADTYINAAGGADLYTKDYFKKENIDLYFIQNQIQAYKQFNNEFIPYLSIIDVLMFNSKEEIRSLLQMYKLV